MILLREKQSEDLRKALNALVEIYSWWVSGGFKYVLFLSRKLGKIPILTNIFSDGLKPPSRLFLQDVGTNFHLMFRLCVLFMQACSQSSVGST